MFKNWVSPKLLTRAGILTMNRRNIDYIARYNRRYSYPLVDNKLKTKMTMADFNIKTPELLLVVSQQHEIQRFWSHIENLDGFAIKPAKGSGGKGILVIVGRKDGLLIKASGKTISAQDLERHLSNILAGLYSLGGSPDVAIVEALVRTAPKLAEFSFQGVPDIRIVVFRGYPVMAMLRLATQTSDGKANLHQGAVGVGLDLATGSSLNSVQFDRPISLHPDNQQLLDHIHIDDWPELLTMAAHCYEATGLGYMGVDIVIDEQRGPLLLELNARPGLAIQMANGKGLLGRLRHVEQLKRPHYTPSERAQYSLQTISQI